MNAILLIAHAPLANACGSARCTCSRIAARASWQSTCSPTVEETLGTARIALDQLARQPQVQGVLVLADISAPRPATWRKSWWTACHPA